MEKLVYVLMKMHILMIIVHVEKHGNKVLILSIIDNLLKGASGQAVHNMNLMFGLAEDCGLKLKSVAF